MASNINTNTIDENYPVAGIDNDSQGFRDNFTSIKIDKNVLTTITIHPKDSSGHAHEISMKEACIITR